jgi:hypothetical protein
MRRSNLLFNCDSASKSSLLPSCLCYLPFPSKNNLLYQNNLQIETMHASLALNNSSLGPS